MIHQIAKETTVELRSQIAYRKFQELLLSLIERGGPAPQEYAALSHAIRDLGDEVRARAIPTRELRHVMKKTAIEHFQGTMQAASILKKHGYSGDFEIIDDIYQMRIAEKPCLRKWDLYFHAQAAPCAVRNRKSYFHQLLRTLSDRCDASQPRVLNIASGPARDMREWFDAHPDSRIHFDCIELDTKAIAHANSLCAPYLDRMHYHHQNALKFVPTGKYDLIWSAGFFDYLSDHLFVRLLRSLLPFVKERGEVVVGNFSEFNASRDYMELLGDWYLEHRSEERLRGLAEKSGAPARQIEVLWEPEGVNYFLHVHSCGRD